MQRSYSQQELGEVAAELWSRLKGYRCWAFYAPMGAGKTTLIHALATHLQVQDAVGSPTFAIVNEYYSPLAGTVYHMDWYRLRDEEEAIQAGVEDLLYAGAYCWVEWPEKAPSLLPRDTVAIHIAIINENTRKLALQLPESA